MLIEGSVRYNKVGLNLVLLWNKVVFNLMFCLEVDKVMLLLEVGW